MTDSPSSSRSLHTFTSLPLGGSCSCSMEEPLQTALDSLRSSALDSPSSRWVEKSSVKHSAV